MGMRTGGRHMWKVALDRTFNNLCFQVFSIPCPTPKYLLVATSPFLHSHQALQAPPAN